LWGRHNSLRFRNSIPELPGAAEAASGNPPNGLAQALDLTFEQGSIGDREPERLHLGRQPLQLLARPNQLD
jgi:hypothetical protein